MASEAADDKSTGRKTGLFSGFRRKTGVGAVPGTIDPSIPAGLCRINRLVYGPAEVTQELLPDHQTLGQPPAADSVTWIQIHGTPDADTLRKLASAYGIHSLALEDVSNTHQRCKVEDYGSYLFVVTRLPRYADDGILTTDQVSLFIGVHFVVSIHDGPDIFESVRNRIIRSRMRMRDLPADYLGYAILDTVTDHYFPVIEEIGHRLNLVDDKIEEGVNDDHRSEIRDLRSDLLQLRRAIWPQRDALSALMRDDCELISQITRTYLRDCYDHTVQIIDVTETYRELCADLRDYHLAEISFRSNEVMRTLTVIATLFMPLSFIAGFYGMNFQHMPELGSKYGYPLAILAMATLATSLLLWFRKKGWLG